jgi:hypothetical protein
MTTPLVATSGGRLLLVGTSATRGLPEVALECRVPTKQLQYQSTNKQKHHRYLRSEGRLTLLSNAAPWRGVRQYDIMMRVTSNEAPWRGMRLSLSLSSLSQYCRA